MKKSLIALAALAAVSAASAQSTATLSGSMAFVYQTDTTGNIPSGNTAASSGAKVTGIAGNDMTLKFTAVEDLGGGLKATGAIAIEGSFHRGSAVTMADRSLGVSGGFGAVTASNTRSSDLLATIGSAGIVLADGVYDTSVLVRGAIDTLGYTSPKISGFTLGLTYVEGNDGNQPLPTTNAKSTNVYSVNYANGPLSASYQIKSAAVSSGSTVKKTQNEFAVTYDAGVVKVGYGWDDKTTTATTDKTASGFSVTAPMGAITVGAQRFARGNMKQTDVGAVYALSKRTSVSIAQGTMKGRATTSLNGTQTRLRLNHTF